MRAGEPVGTRPDCPESGVQGPGASLPCVRSERRRPGRDFVPVSGDFSPCPRDPTVANMEVNVQF